MVCKGRKTKIAPGWRGVKIPLIFTLRNRDNFLQLSVNAHLFGVMALETVPLSARID